MSLSPEIRIIETPRDGMQGLDAIIPTRKKVEYINMLLRCGFDTVEVGSFVSPRAIPQMADTAEVLRSLDYEGTRSKIAVLAANLKGCELAMDYDVIDQVFYPYSTSPTFLKKNLNTTLAEAERTVAEIQNLCVRNGKELVAFISLAFGDPYGDPWSTDLVISKVEKLVSLGVRTIPLADTIGDVHPDVIDKVCEEVVPHFPQVEFGLHAHAYPGKGKSKIGAAWKHGVRRFDTVINGLGGCPMTDKELVGNLSLESLLTWCENQGVQPGLDMDALARAKSYPLLINTI